jgi:hypothetical protein
MSMNKLLTLMFLTLAACGSEVVLDGQDYTDAFSYQKQTVCTAVRDLGLANIDQCLYMDHVRVLLVEDMSSACDGEPTCYRSDLQVIYVNPAVNPTEVRHEYVHAAMDQLGMDDKASTSDGHSGLFLSILNHGDRMVHDHE